MNKCSCIQIKSIPLIMILIASNITGSLARGEVLPGEPHCEPYVVLSDDYTTQMVMQAYGFLYSSNLLYSSLDTNVLENVNFLLGPECYLASFLRSQGVTNDLLLVNKITNDDQVCLSVEICSNTAEQAALMTFLLERTNQAYICRFPATNSVLDMSSPFIWATSLHPFCYSNLGYLGASTTGLVQMQFTELPNDNEVYVNFSSNTFRSVGDLLPEYPELSRLVSLAMTDNVTNFVNVFSSALYPELQTNDFTNNVLKFQTLMKAFQRPDELCMLTSIRGSNTMFDFIMPSRMTLDNSSIDLVSTLRFVKEADVFALTPRLVLPVDASAISSQDCNPQQDALGNIDSMIETRRFHNGVVNYVLATPPLVSFEQLESSVYESVSTCHVALVLSWPSKSSETVEVVVTSGADSNRVDYMVCNTTLVFEAGVTTASVDVAVNLNLATNSDARVQLEIVNASKGLRLGRDITHVLTIHDVSGFPAVQFPVTLSNIDMPAQGETNRISIPLVMSFPWASNLFVDVFALNCTATNGVDYVVSPQTIVFAPFETNKNVDVEVIGKENTGEQLFFKVLLTNAVNAMTSDKNVITVIMCRPSL